MSIAATSTKSLASAKFIARCSVTMILPLLISQGVAAETLTAPEGPLVHTLGKLDLALNNNSNRCQLLVANKSADKNRTIPLLLKSPCYWITSNETKALLHFSYESQGADHTLLVAGTPLDWSDEKKSYQKLPDNAYCTQYLQGAVISKGEVFAIDEKMIAAHCETGLAIDEKIFYAMAHNPERYQEKVITDTTEKKPTTLDTKAAAAALSKGLPQGAKGAEEKTFLESVTDSVKEFFSGKTEDAK